jgi:hypothetical protein
MLFMMPNTWRFGYFRLIDQIGRGTADPSEILATQEKYANHFIESEAWRRFRETV